MTNVVVLGAGMVGGAIAADLCGEFSVTAADLDGARLESLAERYPVRTVTADLSDETAVRKLVGAADLVVGAVPGFLGFQTLRTVIDCGRDVVDISFFGEDPFLLDEAARERGVTAVVDCGVAPGMSHIILGRLCRTMAVTEFECLVGGLPVKRTWPFQYKAPFSPIDVIEEYIRPARIVKDGTIVVREALSDPEVVDFDPIGTLEAFNTDGLRTLLRTMAVPNMREKTLRYPGHIEYIRVLRENGFFGKAPVDVGGLRVRPIDLTAKLLFREWKLETDEPELTVMRVTVRGLEDGRPRVCTYELFDRYDEKTGTSSMARTTGYTCTAAVRLLAGGAFDRKGICPPEWLGESKDCFDRILADLAERNIRFRANTAEDGTTGPSG